MKTPGKKKYPLKHPGDRLPVPHIRAAVESCPELLEGVGRGTALRYLDGEFPQAVWWIAKHPELLAAFVKDAQQLQGHVVEIAA